MRAELRNDIRPIAQAFTDGDDTYNFSMGYVAQRWPNARVVYRYTNRDSEHRFRDGFDAELRLQLAALEDLRFSAEEFAFFEQNMPWLPRPYLQWLGQHRFDASQIRISQKDGRLDIEVHGLWYETIYWEVKLLSIISELSARPSIHEDLPPLAPDWRDQIHSKARRLSEAGVQWIDFGTRRRFSFEVQDVVVEIMAQYPGFRGTSNPYLAMKHGVKAIGTYAHQLPMAMQAAYGHVSADRMAMQEWQSAYRGNLGIALSDTLTTENFLRVFDSYYANLFTGVRQDSGDPVAFGERMIQHYKSLGIDPMTKVVVFSDSLNVDKAIMLHRHFEGRIRTTMGIGTHFTADPAMTGRKALNHVIKLVQADFGNGPIGLVKLSDDIGKATGRPEDVELVRRLLGV
jgi:nicotinate phosphoribosyltransferase